MRTEDALGGRPGRPGATRLAAAVVISALGVNVWVSLVLAPWLFAGSLGRRPVFLALAALPLGVLALGVVRRAPSALLLAFPASLLLAVVADARPVTDAAQDPLSFALVAAGLVGYLLGAAALGVTDHRPGAAAPPVAQTRKLATPARTPSRWRRRGRIYWALALYSMAFPAALLWALNFAPDTRAYLEELYPDRAGALIRVLNVALVPAWLGLFAWAFVAPLRHHRTGDRPLVRRLERLRVQGTRSAPGPRFYAAVVCALVFMALLVFARYR